MLIACGNTTQEKDAYTKDAQVDEQKSDVEKVEDAQNEEESKDNSGTDNDDILDKDIVSQDSQNSEGQASQEKQSSSTGTTPPPVVNEKPVEAERVAKGTISIDTKTLLNRMDQVAENKRAYVPSDGWILAPITVEVQEGESVFDVLSRVTRERRIHMEYQGANQSIYNSVYIQGIGQLYEFDCGELSGWMYTINGAYVSKGASGVKVEDGMRIEWRYTCDLGRDLGR